MWVFDLKHISTDQKVSWWKTEDGTVVLDFEISLKNRVCANLYLLFGPYNLYLVNSLLPVAGEIKQFH